MCSLYKVRIDCIIPLYLMAERYLIIFISVLKLLLIYKKVKGKGRLWVLQHCCLLRHIVLLPERDPSFISRGAAHTKRREGFLLAKEGTISGIWLAIRNSRKLLSSFTCRKAGTWDRFFYYPSGRKHAEDVYVLKNPTASAYLNPRPWMPEASMLTTRPPNFCVF
jgi:hypothetical protein